MYVCTPGALFVHLLTLIKSCAYSSSQRLTQLRLHLPTLLPPTTNALPLPTAHTSLTPLSSLPGFTQQSPPHAPPTSRLDPPPTSYSGNRQLGAVRQEAL